MSDEIRISPKYGLNPTMPVCFWCGKEKGEIAILGYIDGDIEAPRSCCIDYEPCDECKANMERGVTIIEASLTPNGYAPIQDGVYPTGKWVVVTPEAAERLGISAKKVLMEEEAFENLFAFENLSV